MSFEFRNGITRYFHQINGEFTLAGGLARMRDLGHSAYQPEDTPCARLAAR
jgi:hypothetical protein